MFDLQCAIPAHRFNNQDFDPLTQTVRLHFRLLEYNQRVLLEICDPATGQWTKIEVGTHDYLRAADVLREACSP